MRQMCAGMGQEDIRAARAVLQKDTKDLYEYSRGIGELQNLVDYAELHDEAVTAVRTWSDGWAFFAPDREAEHEQARRAFTYYIISANLLVEYLSVHLLARAFRPAAHEDALPGPLKNMAQHEREDLLVQFEVITDDTRNLLSDLRQKRNDVGHYLEESRDLAVQERPIEQLTKANEGVSILIKELYGSAIKEIVGIVRRCFDSSSIPDITEWTTGQVVLYYRRVEYDLARKYGPLDLNEDDHRLKRFHDDIETRLEELNMLENELRRRGYNPDTALDAEVLPSEPTKNVTKEQPGGGLLAHIKDTEIPDEGSVNSTLEFAITVSLDPDPASQYIDVDAEEIEWYGLLIIDERVGDTSPTDENGEREPVITPIEDDIHIEFDHRFQQSGTYEVVFAVHVETEAQVITVRTEEQSVQIAGQGSVGLGDLRTE